MPDTQMSESALKQKSEKAFKAEASALLHKTDDTLFGVQDALLRLKQLQSVLELLAESVELGKPGDPKRIALGWLNQVAMDLHDALEQGLQAARDTLDEAMCMLSVEVFPQPSRASDASAHTPGGMA